MKITRAHKISHEQQGDAYRQTLLHCPPYYNVTLVRYNNKLTIRSIRFRTCKVEDCSVRCKGNHNGATSHLPCGRREGYSVSPDVSLRQGASSTSSAQKKNISGIDTGRFAYRALFASYYPIRPQPVNVAIFSQVESHTTPDSTVHACTKKRICVLPLVVAKWGTHPNC